MTEELEGSRLFSDKERPLDQREIEVSTCVVRCFPFDYSTVAAIGKGTVTMDETHYCDDLGIQTMRDRNLRITKRLLENGLAFKERFGLSVEKQSLEKQLALIERGEKKAIPKVIVLENPRDPCLKPDQDFEIMFFDHGSRQIMHEEKGEDSFEYFPDSFKDKDKEVKKMIEAVQNVETGFSIIARGGEVLMIEGSSPVDPFSFCVAYLLAKYGTSKTPLQILDLSKELVEDDALDDFTRVEKIFRRRKRVVDFDSLSDREKETNLIRRFDGAVARIIA